MVWPASSGSMTGDQCDEPATGECDPIIRIVPGRDEAARGHDVRRLDIQLAGGDAGEPPGYALGRELVPATAQPE